MWGEGGGQVLECAYNFMPPVDTDSVLEDSENQAPPLPPCARWCRASVVALGEASVTLCMRVRKCVPV